MWRMCRSLSTLARALSSRACADQEPVAWLLRLLGPLCDPLLPCSPCRPVARPLLVQPVHPPLTLPPPPLLRSGGYFVLSTPNRNILSYLAVIVAAEWILGWIPIGMHQWSKFLKPEELEAHLRQSGLVPTMRRGFVFDPLFWRWHIKDIDWIDYIVTCVKPHAS